MTTATSPSPTCRRCGRSRPGSTRSAPPCPSCRPLDARGTWHDLGLSPYDAAVLTAEPAAGRLFEGALAADPTLKAKTVANWVTGESMRLLKPEVEALSGPAIAIDPAQLARLVALVEAGDLSGTNAKQVLEAHARDGTTVDALVERLGLRQINDEAALVALVDGVLARHPGPVAELRAGKAQVLGFLVGQVMAASRGQANAAAVRALLERRLAKGALTPWGPWPWSCSSSASWPRPWAVAGVGVVAALAGAAGARGQPAALRQLARRPPAGRRRPVERGPDGG